MASAMYSEISRIFERMPTNMYNTCLLKSYWCAGIMIPLLDEKTPTYGSHFGMLYRTALAMPPLINEIGLVASDPEVYNTFAPLYDRVIKDYHKLKIRRDILHPPSYFGGVTDLGCTNMDPDGQYIVAVRVHIHRNLSGYRFANAMTVEERIKTEDTLKEALCSLSGEFQGTYHPIESLNQDLKDELTKEHLLLDNSDPFLTMGHAYTDWPNNRGIFVNKNKTFVAWVNGQDHLQLITAERGADIGPVYTQMIRVVQMLERKLSFAKDDRLGFLTYCPSNLGTGLHATVLMNLPHLAAKVDFEITYCRRRHLNCKSLETVPSEGYPPLSAISNKRTIGYTEIDLVIQMMTGVQKLIKKEQDKQDKAQGKGKKCSIS